MRRNFGKHSDVFWFLAGALFGFLLILLLAAHAHGQDIVAAPLAPAETARLAKAYADLATAQKAVEAARVAVAAAHPTIAGRPCGYTFSADFTVIMEGRCPPSRYDIMQPVTGFQFTGAALAPEGSEAKP